MQLSITSLTRRATAFDRAPAAQLVQPSLSRAVGYADTEPAPPADSSVTWSGTLVLENTMTGDGRLIEKNALRWATLPILLRWAREDNGGHDGAVVVGKIKTLTRSGNLIKATGDFDMETAEGQEAARQVDRGLTNGVSVDLDEVSFEIRVAKELMDEMDDLFAEPEDGEAEPAEIDDEGRITVLKMGAEDEVMVTTDARIRAATLVGIPAFEEARIVLDQALASAPPENGTPAAGKGKLPNGDPCSCTEGDTDYDPDCDCSGEPTGDTKQAPPPPPAKNSSLADLTAGGFPIAPPASWFADPKLDGPTPLHIGADGRIWGHLAEWGTCHVGFPGQCVTPPSSETGYSYFRVGSIITKEGSEIPVGHITMDTFHAGKTLSASDTMAHYEHTGSTVADVAAGEDAWGIWVAGAVRPGVSAEKLRDLRSSPLSGDWRRVGGNLELLAALAVNVPGFPIPRPQGLVASGVTTSLIASGMLPPRKVIRPGAVGALSADDLRYLKRLADRERRVAAGVSDKAAALARRVRSRELAHRVRSRVKINN
jgi:hypothetical protein